MPIEKVTVSFYLTHTYDSDLEITLVHPDGVTLSSLSFEEGGSDNDFGTSAADADRTVFDDDAVTAISAGAAPFVGSFQPDSPLSVFDGLAPDGNWELQFKDTAGADTGTVYAASLFITVDGVETRLDAGSVPLAIPDSPGGPATIVFTYITADGRMVGVATFGFEAFGEIVRERIARWSTTLFDRWHGGNHIGDAIPNQTVKIRPGRFNRAYGPWTGSFVDVTVGDTDPDNPWQATWTPSGDGDYTDVPNVLGVDLNNANEQRGIGTATITIENIIYKAEAEGHHSIHRGYLAPLRGYVADGRDALTDEHGAEVVENEWFGMLTRNSQVVIEQGYGDELYPVFTGLIDDVDTRSKPDQITVTLRDFGQVLADERMFGWNIDPAIKDPVVFIDRDDPAAGGTVHSGHDTAASSEIAGHEAPLVRDGDSDTSWQSQNHASGAVTEWVEVYLAEGTYDEYFLWPEFAGMEVYISIWAEELGSGGPPGPTTPPTRDGVDIPAGWVTGVGIVPGANGGVPYVKKVTGLSARAFKRELDATYELGNESILRLSFRTLPLLGGGNHRAGVRTFHGRRRYITPQAAKQHWVLTDDISDMVKTVLRWAGFKEWEVETVGVPFKKRYVVTRDQFYADVIEKAKEVTGYTFFIAAPSDNPDSIGVPTFRKSLVVADDIVPMVPVTDGDVLTAIDVKQSDEPLSYIIRVRGRESNDDGATLGGDTTKRIMYVFRPPWIGTPPAYADGRMGGIIKHVIHTDHLFTTLDDCKFGAYYVALQQALESTGVIIEMPGFPPVELDDIIELMDLGTGLTTRVCVTNRRSTFTTGEDRKYVMTLQGPLIDIPDVQDMVDIIRAARRAAG